MVQNQFSTANSHENSQEVSYWIFPPKTWCHVLFVYNMLYSFVHKLIGRISLHSFAYVNKQENWVSHCRNVNSVVAWIQAQVVNSNSTSAVQDPQLLPPANGVVKAMFSVLSTYLSRQDPGQSHPTPIQDPPWPCCPLYKVLPLRYSHLDLFLFTMWAVGIQLKCLLVTIRNVVVAR